MAFSTITNEHSYQKQMAEFIADDFKRRDEEALWWLLNDERGRWFINRLLDKTCVVAKCFTGNSTTFYNEGRRDVGLGVVASIAQLGLDAVKLKQKGELEYIENQIKAQQLFVEKEGNKNV